MEKNPYNPKTLEDKTYSIRRCFSGWEAIKDQYTQPGSCADIVITPVHDWHGEIKDAILILDHLQYDDGIADKYEKQSVELSELQEKYEDMKFTQETTRAVNEILVDEKKALQEEYNKLDKISDIQDKMLECLTHYINKTNKTFFDDSKEVTHGAIFNLLSKDLERLKAGLKEQ